MKHVNKKSLVTLFVLSTFSIITVTSVLMYAQPYNSAIALLHTIIGFSLLLMALLHIKNNFNALKNHIKIKLRAQGAFNFALPMVVIITLTISVFSYFRLPPMEYVYKWGNILRASSEELVVNELKYTLIDKSLESNDGAKLTVDLRRGEYFYWPQYAIWIEDLEGNFVQPLFVTSKIATNSFVNKVTKVNQEVVFDSHVLLSGKVDLASTFEAGVFPESKSERARPESLPVFLHKHKQMNQKQTLIPEGETAIADAYTGATVNQSFLLETNLENDSLRQFRIRLEINSSFDFNEYYSSDRFPDDPVYSGNGYSAQPSLIYEAIIDLENNQSFYPMHLIGRGHHSGRNGEIYKDLENITTAKAITERIIVEIQR